VAVALFDAFKRTDSSAAFGDASLRRCCSPRFACTALAMPKGKISPKSRTQIPAWPAPTSRMEQPRVGVARAGVRYHRGSEPREQGGPFSKLSADQKKRVRALAGVLRLARALRKCGVASGAGLRAEKSSEAIVLRVPGLSDDVESASRLRQQNICLKIAFRCR